MGLFGNAFKSLANPDVLMQIGAALKDASAGGSDNLLAVRKDIVGRQKLAQQQALQKAALGLFGGSAPSGPAPMDPDAPSVSDMVTGTMAGDPNAPTLARVGKRLPQPQSGPPRIGDIVPKLAALQAAGLDTGPYLDMLKAAQPDLQAVNGVVFDPHDGSNVGKKIGTSLGNVNGWQVDQQDAGNAGKFFGAPPVAGAVPVFDQNRNQVGWHMQDGSIQAIQQASEADTSGKTRGTMMNVPTGDGRTAMMTGGQYLDGGQGGASGLGLTQSPADAAAAKMLAESQASAKLGLPQAVQSAETALALIDKLKTDPALEMRVGAYSLLPAMPGTKGADFDARADQLKGKVFLEAFSSLKGAGQITEVEGKKATDAIARLNRSQSAEGYRAALDDLASVIQSGRARASALADGQTQGQPAARSPPPRKGAISREDAIAELKRRGRWPGGQ